MSGRRIIGSAVVCYLIVLGCVLWPDRSSGGKAPQADSNGFANNGAPSNAKDALPLRGVALQIQRVDWLDKYKKSIDEIADLGADTVSLVVDTRQENGKSSRIYLDMRMTPTPETLAAIIDHAKSKNLKVVLMPIVLLDAPRGTEWRGTLAPESWDEWFNSYREMITHFAWIAEGHKVDVLVVGSELVSTESKAEEWRKTIKQIRGVYKGLLTYSANWDHYTSIPFWDQLDLIGMNSYYKLGEDHEVKVEEIVRRWQDIQQDLFSFQREVGKPLLLLEAGWCSMQNAADEPWDYTKTDEPLDLELQRKLYEGFFRAWHGNPRMGGFMMWEWPPDAGGMDDRGYTPKGKPAEKVLREWLAKPRWEVK
jgi:hypothetical protein